MSLNRSPCFSFSSTKSSLIVSDRRWHHIWVLPWFCSLGWEAANRTRHNPQSFKGESSLLGHKRAMLSTTGRTMSDCGIKGQDCPLENPLPLTPFWTFQSQGLPSKEATPHRRSHSPELDPSVPDLNTLGKSKNTGKQDFSFCSVC